MKNRITIAAVGALALTLLPLATSAQDSEGDSETALELVSLVLAKGIEEGQPVEPGDTFSQADGRVFAIVRLSNPSRTETHVRVAFEKAEGAETQGLELSVPARPRYRTVARTGTSREPGRYRCVVRDANGTILGQQEFTITE